MENKFFNASTETKIRTFAILEQKDILAFSSSKGTVEMEALKENQVDPVSIFFFIVVGSIYTPGCRVKFNERKKLREIIENSLEFSKERDDKDIETEAARNVSGENKRLVFLLGC